MDGLWNMIRVHLPEGLLCMHLKKEEEFPADVNVDCLRREIINRKEIPDESFYLTHNGRRLEDDSKVAADSDVNLVLRLRGGKGGFGSMLRAIGAQIEKTTNREACRDLSGRRLRDINEEKRLKKWIAQKAEREREASERKKQKWEQMCREPKHEFHDLNYDRERSELTEKVSDAVHKGFQVAAAASSSSSSSTTVKRKMETVDRSNKKKCLWLGVDEAELNDLSSDDDSSDEEKTKTPPSIAVSTITSETSADVQESPEIDVTEHPNRNDGNDIQTSVKVK